MQSFELSSAHDAPPTSPPRREGGGDPTPEKDPVDPRDSWGLAPCGKTAFAKRVAPTLGTYSPAPTPGNSGRAKRLAPSPQGFRNTLQRGCLRSPRPLLPPGVLSPASSESALTGGRSVTAPRCAVIGGPRAATELVNAVTALVNAVTALANAVTAFANAVAQLAS